ncbi:MAG: hypothetical protein NXH75_10180 [Halobacteriovoraceae bacterium]|nr:hypothetical protein [Halobacteriovoraceae bacterium]
MMSNFSRKISLSIALLLLVASCDAPRTQRRVAAGSANDFSLFGGPLGNTTGGTTTGGTTTSGTTTGDTGGTTIPSDATHCTWSSDGVNGFTNGHAHLSPNEDNATEGAYTLCQSSTSETDIYIQVKNPINGHQLCLIPTYNSGTNSVYIGEPRCLYVKNNTSIYKVTLIKNRTGYSSYAVTGVMVMRDKAYEYGAPFYQVILSPDAYIFCSQWLAQYGDTSYCIPFKSAGHYLYHQF